MKVQQYLIASLFLILCSFSHAVVIDYDETLDGDLSDTLFSFDVSNSNYLGYFDIGYNIVSGSSFYQNNPLIRDDDYFHFSIQEEHQLISMSVSNSFTQQVDFVYAFNDATLWSAEHGYIANLAAEIFWLDGDPFILGQPDRGLYPNPNTKIFSPGLGVGDYTVFSLGPSGGFTPPNASITWDYIFTFEVVPIPLPLPATAWLFLSALGLIRFTKIH